MRPFCLCCVLVWLAGQGCAAPAQPAPGTALPAKPDVALVEASTVEAPTDRTLVVQSIVAWEWVYRFEGLTVGGPPSKQTRGGVTLEVTGSGRTGEGTDDERVRVTYSATRPKAIGELRFVTVEALSNGRTVVSAGSRFGQTGSAITGRWDLWGRDLPDRFTLAVTVRQPLLPDELIALQQARGPLIPGEVPYAVVQARLSEAVERVTGTRWAISDTNAPTGELFSHPVYEFGIGGGPFPREVRISRLTGEVLAVSGQIVDRMQIPGSDPVERIWSFVTQWCPDYPRDRAVADDPPSVVYSWDDQGNRALQYGWFVPDMADPSTGEHLTVEVNTKGRPTAMYRLLGTTANRPSVSLARAEGAATAFLRERSVDTSGYATSEVNRQYRGGTLSWPRDRGRPSADAVPWRFMRMLEFRPTDLTRESHWVWVDAHTGTARDWMPFPTPTAKERAVMMGPPDSPPARPSPPPLADASQAPYEALLQHGGGIPETPFEQVLNPAEAPGPPMDFDAFVALIPVKPPLSRIERMFPDTQGTMAFTPLYPALPPGSRIARAIQIGERDGNGNQARSRTTRAVAVYYASPAEVLFFMATVPGLAPKLEQPKSFSIASGISGTTGTLRGIPAARAEFPNCTMLLLGKQAPEALADRLCNASPGGVGSGGPLDGVGAQSWIVPGVTPGTKGPLLKVAIGAEQLVVQSLQRVGPEFVVEGQVPSSWAGPNTGRMAVACWVIDAAGRLWRGRGSSWDTKSGAFEMTLQPTRAVAGEADPAPRMPLLVIVKGPGTVAPVPRSTAELSYLPMAGREVRYQPVPHWAVTLRLEHVRLGDSGLTKAGGGQQFRVSASAGGSNAAGTPVVALMVEQQGSQSSSVRYEIDRMTLIDQNGKRWPYNPNGGESFRQTSPSGRAATAKWQEGGWFFAVDRLPTEFTVEVDLVNPMGLEPRELAAVAWRSGGPIAPGERTVFELIDAARPVLARLGLSDTDSMKFQLGRADVTRTNQPTLEFRALLTGRSTLSVRLDRRTGEVVHAMGSAGLFPTKAGDSATLAAAYRDLLFRPAEGVSFEEIDHAAQEGHGAEFPASVMYRWQGRLADGRRTLDRVVVSVNADGSLRQFLGERHQGPYPVVNLTAAQARAAAETYLRGKNQYPSGVRGVTVTEEYVATEADQMRRATLGLIGGVPLRYVFTVRYDLGMKPYMDGERPEYLDVYVDTKTGAVLRAQGPGYR